MAKYQTTSLTLLGRVREGRNDAWSRLVELYAPLLRYWCRRSDLSPEDTADIFQETFQAVARKIEEFRRDKKSGTFRGWLRTIAMNKIRDLFRRREKQAAASGGTDAQLFLNQAPDPLVDDEEAVDEAEPMQAGVRRALQWIRGDFTETTWKAFWLCQIEQQSTADVGAKLNMTPAAVRKAKYRVLQRLREELTDLL